nr:MAG: major capsid protein [Microvirus sp.]
MSNKLFGGVAIRKPRTNTFDLSHERKLSMNMGDLIPVLMEEVVPGDKFKVNSEILLRFAPMLAPMMHRVNVYTHYFFVPSRIVFDGWEDFITGGADGADATVMPYTNLGDSNKSWFGKKRVGDYFGLPVLDETTVYTNSQPINMLPFRAYQEIFNEYFRDQNLSNPVPFSKGETVSIEDVEELTTIRKRAWEKDYFTSALPWAQRGGDVSLPIESTLSPQYEPWSKITDQAGSGVTAGLNITSGPVGFEEDLNVLDGVAKNVRIENLTPEQEIDSTSVTINELRKAVRLQEWLEKNARAGSRYVEQILSHFGVKSSDARLQRPEYLGGGKSPVVVSEVLSTIATTGTEPQGNMSGHGLSVGKSNTFTKSFEEHGYVIGIMSVLPRSAYQNTVERVFTKRDKFDYYWPEFAHLGEQEIYTSEIYSDLETDPLFNNWSDTWGYQSRYAEYKFRQSSVHSDFRDTLSYWHLGRQFTETPPLNEAFVTHETDDRIFAVVDPSEDKLYVQIYNSIKAQRPMPQYGTPSL